MAKKLRDIKWVSVALEGFPLTPNDFHGFVGLEECTDYGFDKETKKPKMKKEPKKRKSTLSADIPTKKGKQPLEYNKKKATSERLSNGFIVECCDTAAPSLANDIPVKSNKKHKKKKEVKSVEANTSEKPAKKYKLGENKVDAAKSLTLEEMQAWSSLEIPEEILKSLAEQGFQKPTKIQELTLPAALLGRKDILGAAETGSGKTLAFGIPIIAGIMKLKQQQLAGEDPDKPYKKSSAKKKAEPVPENGNDKKIKKNKKMGKQAKNKKNAKESSEEGYSSKDDDEQTGDDRKSSDDEYLEEYDVPIKKKDSSADECYESDDSNENDVHLSNMIDNDNMASSSEEENDFNDDSDGVDEDNDSQEEVEGDDDDEENDSSEDINQNAVGLVRVVEDVLPPPRPAAARPARAPLALVLTPTRELALQVSRHLAAAAKYTGVRVSCVVGGMARVKQERVLARGTDLLVATPGRLAQLLAEGEPALQHLHKIQFLAIDETDRMTEREHFLELPALLDRANSDVTRGRHRQNFVFSATLTVVHDLPNHLRGKKVTKNGKILNRKAEKMTAAQKVQKLVALVGMTEPKVVDITQHNLGTSATLTECRITCALEHKDYYLYYLLTHHPGRAIVFCNSIGSVKRLAQLFTLLRCEPLPLHAGMPQRQRLKNLERFRDNPRGVLVATDVAARGLDVPGVQHVLHYQVPRTAENYVHRSGRTARASKEGLTILLTEPGEAYNYAKLCRTLNKTSELPQFPVSPHLLEATKQTVNLAREVERLQLSHRRAAQERGWLDRAARDMDIVVDEDFCPTQYQESSTSKQLAAKRKQLEQLIARGGGGAARGAGRVAGKFPALAAHDCTLPAADANREEDALQVMKNALQSGDTKRKQRRGKNQALLALGRQLRGSTAGPALNTARNRAGRRGKGADGRNEADNTNKQ